MGYVTQLSSLPANETFPAFCRNTYFELLPVPKVAKNPKKAPKIVAAPKKAPVLSKDDLEGFFFNMWYWLELCKPPTESFTKKGGDELLSEIARLTIQ